MTSPMFQRTSRRVQAALLAALLLAAPLASAGPATDVVKAKQAELVELLRKPPSKPNQARIAALLDEMLDYDELAQASLGPEWGSLNDAQRSEFRDTVKKLVRRNYERNLKKTLGYEVTYVGEEGAGEEGTVLVRTRVAPKSGSRDAPLEIDFKLAQKGGAWRVRDIITEGASFVATYRSQFTKILKKDGYAVLMRKLKEKLAKNDG